MPWFGHEYMYVPWYGWSGRVAPAWVCVAVHTMSAPQSVTGWLQALQSVTASSPGSVGEPVVVGAALALAIGQGMGSGIVTPSPSPRLYPKSPRSASEGYSVDDLSVLKAKLGASMRERRRMEATITEMLVLRDKREKDVQELTKAKEALEGKVRPSKAKSFERCEGTI